LNVTCVYGGAGIGNQLSELKRGAEIVICTPGRMIDVLCLSNGKITNLQRVTYIVIDEADRMFDLGFEPQIARILANIRPDRQTVMFSATFPKQIESLAKKILINPVEILVGNRGQSCANVEQHVEVLPESGKLYRLLEILGEFSEIEGLSIIIFVDKQIEADELFKELFKLGYNSLVIHGAQDQEDRDFAIKDFKKGVRNILISTSVCARGLDVKNCGLVVNFKAPNHMEDYVHRVGM
jgi:ATP-dependent RNA helicase DDX46/PRP5